MAGSGFTKLSRQNPHVKTSLEEDQTRRDYNIKKQNISLKKNKNRKLI